MAIHKLKLRARHEVAKNTFMLIFDKPNGFTFQPGQYGGFTLIDPPEADAGGITRRFSLACDPEDDFIAIITRIQSSAFKRVLKQLPVGAEIKFAGPTGTFVLHDDTSTPAVLIAGGIGIAPFYSMLKFAANHAVTQPIFLFYGNQTPAEAPLLNELADLKQRNPHMHLINTMSFPDPDWTGEQGFITNDMIHKYIPDLDAPIYYVCGSPAMVTALQETLAEMGINEDRIRTEDFPGY